MKKNYFLTLKNNFKKRDYVLTLESEISINHQDDK